eukprot:3618316-Pyramimonas_sp.AAC.1
MPAGDRGRKRAVLLLLTEVTNTPYCSTCRAEDRGNYVTDVAHVLGGCANSEMRAIRDITMRWN